MQSRSTPSFSQGLKELRNNLSKAMPKEALDVFDADADASELKYDSIIKLSQGDKAPNFRLSNAINETVELYQKLRKSRVVLVFYRGAWCPYCNLALAHYQSILGDIKDADASLIAISPQTPDASLNMKEKNALQYEVLSDNGNMVSRLYSTVFKNDNHPIEVMSDLGFNFDSFYPDDSRELPVPAIFIIEKDGTISFARSEGGDYRNRTEPQDLINQLNKK